MSLADSDAGFQCPIAGGTGCGTFLDAAFHFRHLASRSGGDMPIERIIGILFMPNIFYSNACFKIWFG